MNFKNRMVDLHIIDALDSSTSSSGRSEAMAIRYCLRDTPINIVSHYAWDEQTLKHSITSIIKYRRAYINPRKFLPFLHIACHGTPDGLLIGDDQIIPWSMLMMILRPLSKTVGYSLPISLSSCHGYFGYRLSLASMDALNDERAYFLLIGPRSRLNTRELINSFSTLYRALLVESCGLPSSVEKANGCIQNRLAHLAYTYGVDVARKYKSDRVDETSSFAKPMRRIFKPGSPKFAL